jgi:CheY-like chemotaxis protein
MPQRVLIADDHPLMRAALKQAVGLAFAGCELPEAATYDDLRAQLDAGDEPDLILLDLHMPGLDGFAVMKLLERRIPRDAFLPILVLTADVLPEVKQRALAAGARDFVTKPFDRAEVLLRIKNLLETRFLHLQLPDPSRS